MSLMEANEAGPGASEGIKTRPAKVRTVTACYILRMPARHCIFVMMGSKKHC